MRRRHLDAPNVLVAAIIVMDSVSEESQLSSSDAFMGIVRENTSNLEIVIKQYFFKSHPK